MAAVPIFRISRRKCVPSQTDSVLSFLAPSLQTARSAPQTSVSQFSTSSPQWARDNNRNRGVSALRRTGPRRRQTLSVKKEDLPIPVLSPKLKSKVEVDEDHGLWGFFNKERRLLATPEEDLAHGIIYCSVDMDSLKLMIFYFRASLDGTRTATKVLGRFT